MRKVAIVTDSMISLPRELIDEYDIRVVMGTHTGPGLLCLAFYSED